MERLTIDQVQKKCTSNIENLGQQSPGQEKRAQIKRRKFESREENVGLETEVQVTKRAFKSKERGSVHVKQTKVQVKVKEKDLILIVLCQVHFLLPKKCVVVNIVSLSSLPPSLHESGPPVFVVIHSFLFPVPSQTQQKKSETDH